jgi:hypothetical protein
MEGWWAAFFGFVGVFLGGAFSYWGIKKQVEHSDQRFEKELDRQRQIDSQQWRRNTRSEPLTKLRDELANMAVKLDVLVACAQRTHTRIGGTQEEVEEKLRKAIDDWNSYLANGGIAKVLFVQYDKELVDLIEKIRKDYQQAYFDNINFKDATAENMKEAFDIFEKNKTRIIEVQELINKRLEEL